jgi:hypothetical protein
MIPATRRSIALAVLALALILGASTVALVPVAAGEGTATVKYVKEKLPAFEGQLAAGEVRSVAINRRLSTLLVTLADGRHVRAHFKRAERQRMTAALHARHVHVSVLTPAQAAAEQKALPIHHKLRYIVGAVVIVVIILAVVGVLFYRRRRLAYE